MTTSYQLLHIKRTRCEGIVQYLCITLLAFTVGSTLLSLKNGARLAIRQFVVNFCVGVVYRWRGTHVTLT